MKHILTSVGVGMAIGAGLVYSVMRTQLPNAKPQVVAQHKWCDPMHIIPFIPADQCGGLSSCDRSPGYPLSIDPLGTRFDWPTICKQWNER